MAPPMPARRIASPVAAKAGTVLAEASAVAILGWLLLFIYGRMPVRAVKDAQNASDETDASVRTESFMRALKEQPQAFLSDRTVGNSWLYRIVKFLFYRTAIWFNAFETKGAENFPPPGKGALVVSMHSSHNYDIFLGLTAMYAATGRVPRGMLHRMVYKLHPYTKYLGLVPGQRYTGKHLLQAGFLTCALPGGSEEAMSGHENAYRLHERWSDRRGFAHVAKDANVDIIPIFMQNVDEMKFNLLFFVCNRLGITHAYSRLNDRRLPGTLGWLIKWMGMWAWFSTAWICFPVPVKVTLHIGEPVKIAPEDTVDTIAERTRLALQALIAKHQPYGHAYLPGLRERFALPAAHATQA